MRKKVYFLVMSGECDNNIRFTDLCNLLYDNDFQCRIRGDHYIFAREDVLEIINIQPKGNKAKAYQVKQIRFIFAKYGI